nr:WG repeat-containing protein [Wujia sp.]
MQDNKTGKFGYINKKGKTVIGFKYDYAFSFCDGLACVMKN